jgi:hypothetical protein
MTGNPLRSMLYLQLIILSVRHDVTIDNKTFIFLEPYSRVQTDQIQLMRYTHHTHVTILHTLRRKSRPNH